MSTLDITSRWNTEIHQIENGDKNNGGPNGNVNKAPKQLAENIFFLKQYIDSELSIKDNEINALRTALATEVTRAKQKEADILSSLNISINNISSIPGKSAFECALSTGFVGTQAEWINSLKVTGIQGPAGNTIINQKNGLPINIWLGAQAEYDALGTLSPNTLYMVK